MKKKLKKGKAKAGGRGRGRQLAEERARMEAQRQEDMRRYGDRNRLLAAMGFPSYGDYLASPLWKDIRARVLRRDRWTCQSCKNDGWQVHHRSYSEPVLRGQDLLGLITLCEKCHRAIEFAYDGKKLGPNLANKKFKRLRKSLRRERTPEERRAARERIDFYLEFLRIVRDDPAATLPMPMYLA